VTTPGLRDDQYRRLDGKLNALLAITGINLVILLLALFGVIDLVT
jgi:hypothetical protein